MQFKVRVQGTAYEIYDCTADSPEEAKEMFERGELTKPTYSDVNDAEVMEVVAAEDYEL